eukprot:TRINITY_DN5366_c0_g1_i1.p1 TRINITY_DN5366_c0_g1~~TRINITY_DN5366_c0_g1_i1.p1  ORF type:complete len:593 (+),score=53.78 TRINITY_DN5366_c0_g1_i1:226-1779(+)
MSKYNSEARSSKKRKLSETEAETDFAPDCSKAEINLTGQHLLAELIYRECLPFSLVMSEHFLKFVRFLNPSFVPQNRQSLSEHFLDSAYNYTKNEVNLSIQMEGGVTLAYDGSSDRDNEQFSHLGVIVPSTNRFLITETIIHDTEKKGSEMILQQVETLIDTLKNNKVLCKGFISDNEPKMQKVRNNLQIKYSINLKESKLELSTEKQQQQLTNFINRNNNHHNIQLQEEYEKNTKEIDQFKEQYEQHRNSLNETLIRRNQVLLMTQSIPYHQFLDQQRLISIECQQLQQQIDNSNRRIIELETRNMEIQQAKTPPYILHVPFHTPGDPAHALQLVIKDVLEDPQFASIIQKCQQITTYFKRSKMGAYLKKELDLEPYQRFGFTTSVITRWNSHYDQITSILKRKDDLLHLAYDNQMDQDISEILSSIQFWNKTSQLKDYIEPICKAIDKVQADKCASNVLYVWRKLEKQYKQTEHNDPTLNNLIAFTIAQLNARWNLIADDIFLAAFLFDFRYIVL